MGIKRLIIDSRIQGLWHGHTKTGRDRRWDSEEGRHTPPGQGCQPAAACAVA